jgi:7-cyano-7-deazaguanine synthase in queuosine biosynthesis
MREHREPAVSEIDFTTLGQLAVIRGSETIDETVLSEIRKYHADYGAISRAFGVGISPVLADWIDVAVAAYLADRLVRRRGWDNPYGDSRWERLLRLKVAVREPDLWRSVAVNQKLSRVMHGFTGDQWCFEFVGRPVDLYDVDVQPSLFPRSLHHPTEVALYSGGLDSFAGALQRADNLADRAFVLVSIVTNLRQFGAQQRQVQAIRRLAGRQVVHLPIRLGIDWRGQRNHHEENSQRARGFLYQTLGAATAILAESSELYIYENGVGGINLPYDGTQLGTRSSRGVNPVTLLWMSGLVRNLTGHSFQFITPFLYQTKSQMCRHPAVRRFGDIIGQTFSCDRPPRLLKGRTQCGCCTSCLLRRLSLYTARLSQFDASDRYTVDLLSFDGIASPKHLRHLRAMEWQFERLRRCLMARDTWSALVAEFPELQDVVSELAWRRGGTDENLRGAIVELYREYVGEWSEFPARKLLGTTRVAA